MIQLDLACPVPHTETSRVMLGHGAGGHMSGVLLRDVIIPALGAGAPYPIVDDAATVGLGAPTGEVAFSTDAFVVKPRVFPGGSIGDLAVNGTINDLAMMGARPVAIALSYIVEEGLPVEQLREVSAAVGVAASAAGVPVVTGDTKVVDRGAADGLYLVTSGIGVFGAARPAADRARPGDVIIVSGPIAAHGMAVMSVREGLHFETVIRSDTRPLHTLVAAVLEAAGDTRVLRDPTRGGLASALSEIAQTSAVGVRVTESLIPIDPAVQAACDLLGLDPLQVANEGVCVAFVPEHQADAALRAMLAHPAGRRATVIGRAVAEQPGRVVGVTSVGSSRLIEPLMGEQLPRIC